MRRIVALALLGCTGCAGLHLPQSPSLGSDVADLSRDLDALPPFPEPPRQTGSLWSDAGPGAALVRDTRAYRVNDLVRVKVAEASLGTNSSNTDLNRSSTAEYGATAAFGLEDPTPEPGRFNLETALSATTDMSHSGDGTTARSNRLSGTITARVVRVLPNGDLVLAGQKTVGVNRDKQILTLVGSIRPIDVGPDNSVSSSSVGDLTVRLWGRGEIDDTIRQGWFMRVVNKLWPF
jgi:flagellar L-ring protein precursor FlgH